MVLQGRSEAGCQSVAVRVTPLTRRCRANTGMCEQPGHRRTAFSAGGATQDLLSI